MLLGQETSSVEKKELILKLETTVTTLWLLKTPLDQRCNFSHCKIEIVPSSSDSYTLELSLIALKAAVSSKSCY